MKTNKKLRIIDTFDDTLDALFSGAYIGFFDQLYTFSSNVSPIVKDYLEKNIDQMAIEYYTSYSGEKRISNFFEHILETQSQYQIGGVGIYEIISKLILSKFGDKWAKIIPIFSINYNVEDGFVVTKEFQASNKDQADRSINSNSSQQNASKITNTDTESNTHSVWGFNSQSPVESNKDDITRNSVSTGLPTDNYNQSEYTETNGETKLMNRNESESHKGRNEPMSSLIDKEISFRNNRILRNIIFDDIDSILTLGMY